MIAGLVYEIETLSCRRCATGDKSLAAGEYLDLPVDGAVEIRVLVDRPMLEIIGSQGRVHITNARLKPVRLSHIRAFAEGGAATVTAFTAHELKSIWRK